jgi:hypothetical protein
MFSFFIHTAGNILNDIFENMQVFPPGHNAEEERMVAIKNNAYLM